MADDIRELSSAISAMSDRLARLEGRISPGPVVDPAPWPGPIPQWPFPWPFPRPWPWPFEPPVIDPRPPIGDPAPVDLGRLSQVQLEARMHELNAQKVRLDAAISDVQKQIETAKRG